MSIREGTHVKLPADFAATHGVAGWQGGSKRDWACWIPGQKHTEGLDNGYLAYIPTELLEPLDLPQHVTGKGQNGDGRCEHCPPGRALFSDVDWAADAGLGVYQLLGDGGTLIAELDGGKFEVFAQMTNELWDGVSHPEHFVGIDGADIDEEIAKAD